MTALKGLREAFMLVVIAAVVAAVIAVVWTVVGDGTFLSRLGICLVGAGALAAVTSGAVFTRMGSADAYAWFGRGPEHDSAGGGRVLTGIGIFLFVTLPLVIAGGSLVTL